MKEREREVEEERNAQNVQGPVLFCSSFLSLFGVFPTLDNATVDSSLNLVH